MNRFIRILLTCAIALVLSATAVAGPKQVPFNATFTFATQIAAAAAPCAETRINVSGSGVATHLGRFDAVQHQCASSADPLAFTGGEYRFTAANGDEIFGTYTGRFVPIDTAGNFSIDATFTIDGGTGRFAGATGGGDAGGTATLTGGTVILDGTISFVGSRHTPRSDDA